MDSADDNGTDRHGRHRRRSGRALGRLPPREARPPVRRSSTRTPGSATTGGARWDSLRSYSPATVRWPAGHAVSRRRRTTTRRPRDGRLPRGLRAAVRAARCPESRSTRSSRTGGGGGYRRRGWRPTHRARHVIVATGPFRRADVPTFAAAARPGDPPAPLRRVPRPVAAPGRPGAGRRASAIPARTSPSRRRAPIGPSSPAGRTARYRSGRSTRGGRDVSGRHDSSQPRPDDRDPDRTKDGPEVRGRRPLLRVRSADLRGRRGTPRRPDRRRPRRQADPR